MSTTVAVNRIITIPPEPLTVLTNAGNETTVLPPSVHIGIQPLNLRVISFNKRAGMVSGRNLILVAFVRDSARMTPEYLDECSSD